MPRQGVRARAYAVTVTLLAVVLIPLVNERDSFPHSTYPMFAGDRDRINTLNVAFGLDAGGHIHRLDPWRIAGSIEVIHAAETLGAAIRNGDEARLCEEIAGRVARRGPDDIVTIVVARETHDVVISMVDGPAPLATDERARCPVEADR